MPNYFRYYVKKRLTFANISGNILTMIKEIHIFDIDGTLIDSSHRYRTVHNGDKLTIDLAHWRDNEHLHHLDSPLPLADHFAALLADPHVYTIWITARTASHVLQSFADLVAKIGAPHKIFCRPDGHNGSGAVLKTNQLRSFLALKQFQDAPRFFYEDNLQYLNTVSPAINAEPIYIQSNQGH